MAFPLMNLPSELIVKIFVLLDFEDYISLKSSCKVAKHVAEKNIKFMPKKEKNSMRIFFSFRRVGNSLTIVQTCFGVKDKDKPFTFGSDDNLKKYLSNLKVMKRFFIDAYNPSFNDQLSIKTLLENVEILHLSNIKKPMQAIEILPIFIACKKMNQFFLEARSLINGKFSILLDQMDYCHSVLFCDESNLEIDDECLRIISSKSAPSTPLLQLYAPDTFSSISLPALVEFIRSTNFLRNASIFLSRVYGSRHKLITSFSPLIQPLDSEESLYDFQAIINVTEDVCVRLNIYNLEASAQD